MMRAINCQKVRLTVNNSQEFGKGNDTTPPIAAHTARLPVGIVINHLKIIPYLILQKHNTIAAYTESAVAQTGNKPRILMIYSIFAVIYQNKIVARALVFIKLNSH